jgi:hypothetical protein
MTDAALRHVAAEPSLHGRHPRQAAGRAGWAEEGRRHRGAERLGPTALVEAGGMVERERLEALRECMIVGRHCATMAVAVLFDEQESGEQVNCVVSSMHQACPLYPQLLTYRRGAANRRFGPGGDISTPGD